MRTAYTFAQILTYILHHTLTMSIETDTIGLIFHTQEGSRSPPIKIRRTDQLIKAFEEYAHSEDKRAEVMRFALDGRRIFGDDTPEKLNMVDDDEIDVFIEKHGGGSDRVLCV